MGRQLPWRASWTLLVIVWILEVQPVLSSGAQPLRRYEFSRKIMAVPIKTIFYARNEKLANQAAEAAFSRAEDLDAVLSDYKKESEVCRLSASSGSGKAVKVSSDLWPVLKRAREISRLSGGAFDITVGPVVQVWRRARRLGRLDPERIQKALRLVDYRLLRLDSKNRTAELLKAGMKLDLGGIAKGYVIDEMLEELRKQGIDSALVDAGGDISLGDPPPGKRGWRIAVASLDSNGQSSCCLWLSNVSVATSGSTAKYVIINGKKYSHIVDPRTGLGLERRSVVTVVAPGGMTADAVASAVSVLGPDKGLSLVEEIPRAAARMVRGVEGKVETFQSKGWKD